LWKYTDDVEKDISGNIKDIITAEMIKEKEDKQKAIEELEQKKLSKIICSYTLDGTFVKEYPTVKDATTELNLDTSGIHKVLSGKRKSTGNYIWKYKHQQNEEENKDTVKEETTNVEGEKKTLKKKPKTNIEDNQLTQTVDSKKSLKTKLS